MGPVLFAELTNPLIILLIILAIAAVVAIVAFGIYRYLHPKLNEPKPSEDEFVQEELDRVLQPIEDEETAKKVNEYVDKEDK